MALSQRMVVSLLVVSALHVTVGQQCPGGGTPLAGVYCGRGGTRCPDTHYCEIEPGDRFAVCCPQGVPSEAPPAACLLPPDPGMCRAAFEMWYYSATTRRCEVFSYGGCGGNENNFQSEEACNNMCTAAARTPCPQLMCPHTVCPYGKLRDAAGCPTCQCLQPCAAVRCGPRERCQVVTNDCMQDAVCNPSHVGRCVSSTTTTTTPTSKTTTSTSTLSSTTFRSVGPQAACPELSCATYCPHGQLQEAGCPVCACYDPCAKVECRQGKECKVDAGCTAATCRPYCEFLMCERGGTPVTLPDGSRQSCGRLQRGYCPVGAYCSIHPADAWAVCCSNPTVPTTTSTSTTAGPTLGPQAACPELSCATSCPHGQLQEAGCPVCACYDPCAKVECRQGKECKVDAGCTAATCRPYCEFLMCERGGTPVTLPDGSRQSCGRLQRGYCPVGAYCSIHPADAWAVCCSNPTAPTTTSTTAGPQPPPSRLPMVCSMPAVAGPCRGAMKRWHYDPPTQQCQLFTFGGCYGNDNNFPTREDCETTCPSDATACPDIMCMIYCKFGNVKDENGCDVCKCVDPCKGVECHLGQMCHAEKGRCEKTIEPCPHKASCVNITTTTPSASPVSVGPRTHTCSPIMCLMHCQFGKVKDEFGCDMCKCVDPCEKLDCAEKMCVIEKGECENERNMPCPPRTICVDRPTRTTPSDVAPAIIEPQNITARCQLPKDPGPCRAINPRWFFNSEIQQCEQFTYGGCNGNNNRFTTQEECESSCERASQACPSLRCRMPCEFGYIMDERDCQTCNCFDPCRGVDCPAGQMCVAEQAECEGACPPRTSCIRGPTTTTTSSATALGSRTHTCSPVMCMMYCEYGNVKDEFGCDMCKCVDPCETVNCGRHEECVVEVAPCETYPCPHFGKCRNIKTTTTTSSHSTSTTPSAAIPSTPGSSGSRTHTCSLVMCMMYCEYGKVKDEFGCDICKCVDPCETVNCGRHEECVVEVAPCETYPCPHFGICRNIKTTTTTSSHLTSTTPSAAIPTTPGSSGSRTHTCSLVMCMMYCEFGNVKDEFGCDMCKCVDPCESVQCAAGSQCIIQRVDVCEQHPCKNVAMCAPIGLSRRCSLLPSAGPCKALFQQWFFNVSAAQCQEFTYGGCEGNSNNFDSEMICARECRVCPDVRECPTCSYGYKYVDECQTCECYDPCEVAGCSHDNRCTIQEVTCIRAPCPPVAECRVDRPQPSAVSNACSLPSVAGVCRSFFRRWFHNVTSGACEEFVYGGCGSNGNNFLSRVACLVSCQPDRCPGIACRAECPYGNLLDVDGCPTCACEQPCSTVTCGRHEECVVEVAPCETAPCPYFGICRNKTCRGVQCELECPYGLQTGPDGCPVCACVNPCNLRDCRSGMECRLVVAGCEQPPCENTLPQPMCVRPGLADRCLLPRITGPCEAAMQRWHFNPHSDRCEQFTYGGCQGNGNNFPDSRSCARSCVCIDQSALSCGSCRYGYKENEFGCPTCDCYDPCKEAGCDPRMCTIQEVTCFTSPCYPIVTCNSTVPSPEAPVSRCSLAVDTGSCAAQLTRWHYNTTSGLCAPFTFNGCGGNDNRFSTQVECANTCAPRRCPEIRCRKECPVGAVRDQNGCETCACENPCNLVDCAPGAVCELLPSECGQATCPLEATCVLQACPELECDLPECPFGRVTGESGCELCRCHDPCEVAGCGPEDECVVQTVQCFRAPCYPIAQCISPSVLPPVCPMAPMCSTECPHGLQRNELGCETCDCFDPCKVAGCGPEDECVVQTVQCFRAPCHPIAQCISPSVSPSRPTPTSPGQGRLPAACHLPRAVGPCGNGSSRWHYDTDSMTCVQFNYGGCDGNDNNFESRATCEAMCLPPVCPMAPMCSTECPYGLQRNELGCETCDCFDPCKGVQCGAAQQCRPTPVVCKKAPCRHVGQCMPKDPECSPMMCAMYCEFGFIRDERGCNTCACFQPCQDLACPAGELCRVVEDTACSSTSRDCTRWGETCRTVPAPCQGPQITGPCRASQDKWWFNAARGSCQTFMYGGCQGNDNRFDSEEECEAVCLAEVECPMMKCIACLYGYLKDDYGCNTCQCADNPCQTMSCSPTSECRSELTACMTPPCPHVASCVNKPVCPAMMCAMYCEFGFVRDERGCDVCTCFQPCQTKECQPGLFCQIAEDITCTGQDCQRWQETCVAVPTQCQPRQDVGPCLRRQQKWSYNVARGSCQPFTYGGCRGNTNRFDSLELCQATCTPLAGCPEISCPTACQYGHLLDAYGCKTCACAENPCLMKKCSPTQTCEPYEPTCAGPDCDRPRARCTATWFRYRSVQDCQEPWSNVRFQFYHTQPCCAELSHHLKPGKCPARGSTSLFAAPSPCVDMCRYDADCPRDLKCCTNACGATCTSPTKQEPIAMTQCTARQELALNELYLWPNSPVYMPRCTSEGLWAPMQCRASYGVCWCVHPITGGEQPGTRVRGVPDCSPGGELKSMQPVCPPGQPVHVCSPALCGAALCPAAQNATCRVNPCGGCTVEFYEALGNRKVNNCTEGQSLCHRELQQMYAVLQKYRSTNRAYFEGEDYIGMPSEFIATRPPMPTSTQFTQRPMEGGGRTVGTRTPRSTPTKALFKLTTAPSGTGKFTQRPMEGGGFPDPGPGMPPTMGGGERTVGSRTPMSISTKALFKLTTAPSGTGKFTQRPMDGGGFPDPGPDMPPAMGRGEEQGFPDPGPDVPLPLGGEEREFPGPGPDMPPAMGEREGQREGGAEEGGRRMEPRQTTKTEPVVAQPIEGPVLPQCLLRPGRDTGYSLKQCSGAQCWCVTPDGAPVPGSLSSERLTCGPHGKISTQSDPSHVCADGRVPMICQYSCNDLRCNNHGDEVTCFADPCNNCLVSFRDLVGEEVDDCLADLVSVDICLQPIAASTQCDYGQQKWYFDNNSQTCRMFTYCGAQSNDNRFESEEACNRRCSNIMCGGAQIPSCSNTCADQSCNGNPAAICSVNPCSCEFEFYDLDSGLQVRCDVDVQGVCSRVNAALIRQQLTAPDAAPAQLYSCDQFGNFARRQCDHMGCYCVQPQGGASLDNRRAMVGSYMFDGRSVDENCDDVPALNKISGIIKLKADYPTIIKTSTDREQFMGHMEEQIKFHMKHTGTIKVTNVYSGSIVVEYDVTPPGGATGAGATIARVEYFEGQLRHGLITFKFKNHSLPVMVDGVHMAYVYGSTTTQPSSQPPTVSPTADWKSTLMQPGHIVGIVVAAIALIIIIGLIVHCCIVVKKNRGHIGRKKVMKSYDRYSFGWQSEKAPIETISSPAGYNNNVYVTSPTEADRTSTFRVEKNVHREQRVQLANGKAEMREVSEIQLNV